MKARKMRFNFLGTVSCKVLALGIATSVQKYLNKSQMTYIKFLFVNFPEIFCDDMESKYKSKLDIQ